MEVYSYASLSADSNNDITMDSGTLTWDSDSVWLNTSAVDFLYSYVPDELEDIPPIQGNPDGAKWLVSWAYKQKDPVAFFSKKEDMLKFVAALMNDERVIKESIIIHKLSAQYKPKEVRKMKKLWVKELELRRDSKSKKKEKERKTSKEK